MSITPPDNTEALAATTAADATSLSAYNCEKGDDEPCITAYGVGSCCFWGKVIEVSDDSSKTATNLVQA